MPNETQRFKIGDRVREKSTGDVGTVSKISEAFGDVWCDVWSCGGGGWLPWIEVELVGPTATLEEIEAMLRIAEYLDGHDWLTGTADVKWLEEYIRDPCEVCPIVQSVFDDVATDLAQHDAASVLVQRAAELLAEHEGAEG